jgi:hypothetical protein
MVPEASPPSPQHLAQLAEALPALELLAGFDARLAGAPVESAVGPHEPFVLHVRCDDPDQVHHRLREAGIPARTIETRLHRPRAASTRLPGAGFYAGSREFQVWIFDEASWRQRLRVGQEAAPSRRLSLKAIRALLADAQPREASGT